MKLLIGFCVLATVLAGCSGSSAPTDSTEAPSVCRVILVQERDVALEAGDYAIPIGYGKRLVQGAVETFLFSKSGDLRWVSATATWDGLSQQSWPLRVTVAEGGDSEPYHSDWFAEGPSPQTAYGFAVGQPQKYASYQVTLAPAWDDAAGGWVMPYPVTVHLTVREARFVPCPSESSA